jgi:hypothetical protein
LFAVSDNIYADLTRNVRVKAEKQRQQVEQEGRNMVGHQSQRAAPEKLSGWSLLLSKMQRIG